MTLITPSQYVAWVKVPPIRMAFSMSHSKEGGGKSKEAIFKEIIYKGFGVPCVRHRISSISSLSISLDLSLRPLWSPSLSVHQTHSSPKPGTQEGQCFCIKKLILFDFSLFPLLS